jgi:hypothetical protein
LFGLTLGWQQFFTNKVMAAEAEVAAAAAAAAAKQQQQRINKQILLF